MEDDGGQLLVSAVEPEIKESMRRVVQYFEKAHNVKATKVNVRKFKKSLPLWFACMATEPGKNFAFEMSNRKGISNVIFEWLKYITFCSDHTLSALLTCTFERFNAQYGSEVTLKLMQECRELQQEFKVRIPNYLKFIHDRRFFLSAETKLMHAASNFFPQDMLGENGVFLYPTHPTAAPMHNETYVKPFNFSYTGIINVLGLPATACPLGLNKEGLPIGIQVRYILNLFYNIDV